MNISLTMATLLLLIVAAAAVSCELAAAELIEQAASSPQSGRTANLFKRSLCNTFGGCGSKRSLSNGPHRFGGGGGGDADSPAAPDDERRSEANAKLISEILEDIVEHLQRDQNYKQTKYVVLVPKRSGDGAPYLQHLDVENGAANLVPRADIETGSASTGDFRGSRDELASRIRMLAN